MASPELIKIAADILIAEGGAPGSSLHSWRCEDRLRYPEGCTCVEDTVHDIIDAVLERVASDIEARARDKWALGTDWVAITASMVRGES